MALGNVIAKLSVALAMDTGGLEKGARKSETVLGKLKNFLIGPAGIAAAAGAAGAALGKLVANSINTADEISKAAQSIGVGTEELSRLRYAADISGTSFEQLTKGVGRLSRNMNDAARGLKAPARAFSELGIEVKNSDGTLRTASEVIGDVADKFSEMEDGAKKTALAQEMLGRAGADMIPFLNQGRDGIAQLTDEADRFGVVIDEETGRKAEEFNDNLSRLGGVFSALATRLAAELLPHLLQFTDWLVENGGSLVRHAGKVAEWATFLVRSIRHAVNEIRYLWDWLGHLDSKLGTTWLGGSSKAPVNRNHINYMRSATEQAVNVAKAVMGVKDASEKTAPSLKDVLLPAIETTGARGGKAIRSGISDSLREAQREAENLARLIDRLYPKDAARRRYQEERAMLAGIADEEARLKAQRELARQYDDENRVELPQLEWMRDVKPLTDGLDQVGRAVKRMADKARENTVRIAKSFKDMADDTLSALSRMTSAVQSGGILGILEAVIGLGLQLGSIGAFGKKIQTNLNATPRAFGGPISAGRPYLVGERGPELIVPSHSGRVISNDNMMSTVRIVPSPYFDAVVDDRATKAAAPMSMAAGNFGRQAGAADVYRRQRRRIPG